MNQTNFSSSLDAVGSQSKSDSTSSQSATKSETSMEIVPKDMILRNLQDQFDEIFQKLFTFDTSESKLPDIDQLFIRKNDEDKSTVWDSKLEQAKMELNKTKDKLNDKKIDIWGRHTSFTSLSADVVKSLRKKFGIEMYDRLGKDV
jgi:hypothetical protein